VPLDPDAFVVRVLTDDEGVRVGVVLIAPDANDEHTVE